MGRLTLYFRYWFAFLVLAVLPANGFAADVADLARTWVSPGGVIDSAASDRIIRLLQEDTETNELLQAISGRLGTSNPREVMKIVSLCTNTSKSGKFLPRIIHNKRTLPEDGTEGNWDADSLQVIRSSLETHFRKTDVAEYAVNLRSVAICIQPGRPLLDTFLSFVHELTHFRGFQLLHEDVDVLSFQDAQAYTNFDLDRSGGELEAFTAEFRALARLKQRTQIKAAYGQERYFDANGNLIDRAGLRRYILEEAGYREYFIGRFRDTVQAQFQRAESDLDFHRRSLQVVEKKRTGAIDRIAHLRQYIATAIRDSYPRSYVVGPEQELRKLITAVPEQERRIQDLRKAIDEQQNRMEQIRARFGQYLR